MQPPSYEDANANPIVRAAGMIDLVTAVEYLARVIELFAKADIFTKEGSKNIFELTQKYMDDLDALIIIETEIMNSRRF